MAPWWSRTPREANPTRSGSGSPAARCSWCLAMAMSPWGSFPIGYDAFWNLSSPPSGANRDSQPAMPEAAFTDLATAYGDRQLLFHGLIAAVTGGRPIDRCRRATAMGVRARPGRCDLGQPGTPLRCRARRYGVLVAGRSRVVADLAVSAARHSATCCSASCSSCPLVAIASSAPGERPRRARRRARRPRCRVLLQPRCGDLADRDLGLHRRGPAPRLRTVAVGRRRLDRGRRRPRVRRTRNGAPISRR